MLLLRSIEHQSASAAAVFVVARAGEFALGVHLRFEEVHRVLLYFILSLDRKLASHRVYLPVGQVALTVSQFSLLSEASGLPDDRRDELMLLGKVRPLWLLHAHILSLLRV